MDKNTESIGFDGDSYETSDTYREGLGEAGPRTEEDILRNTLRWLDGYALWQLERDRYVNDIDVGLIQDGEEE